MVNPISQQLSPIGVSSQIASTSVEVFDRFGAYDSIPYEITDGGSKYTLRVNDAVGTIFLKDSVTGKPFLLHDLMRVLAGGGGIISSAPTEEYIKKEIKANAAYQNTIGHPSAPTAKNRPPAPFQIFFYPSIFLIFYLLHN